MTAGRAGEVGLRRSPVDYRRLLWRELGPGGLEALQGLIGKAA